MNNYRQVGVAIVWNSDRTKILIDRRLNKGRLAGYWEFPGGKVEPNESVVDCIAREIKEELGIEIAVGEHLITVNHDYGNQNGSQTAISLIVHQCQHLSGEPQPLECSAVKWVKLSELEQYNLPPANYQIVEALLTAAIYP